MKSWWGLSVLLVLVGCEPASEVGLLTIEATGVVMGIGYIDDNGSGVLDVGDLPLDSVDIALAFPGDQDTALATQTDSTGEFSFDPVPGGEYEIRFDTAQLGDSLQLIELTPFAFTLGAGDTVVVVLGVAAPAVP